MIMLNTRNNSYSYCYAKFDNTIPLNYYVYGVKYYVKQCCYVAYYLGGVNSANGYSKMMLLTKIKPKSPKYVITGSKAFPVYEIKYMLNETIADPDVFDNGKGKLEITRNFIMHKSNELYSVGSVSAYNKKIKALEAGTVIMTDVSEYVQIDKPQYIYLLQERTAVVACQNIYKIGRTEQKNFDRFKGYNKGFEIFCHTRCKRNSKDVEYELLNIFKKRFKHITEYGNEYFQGCPWEMHEIISNHVRT